MTLSQGDIVLVPFPFTDGLSSKVRPAIVISGNRVNNSKDVILVQISSTQKTDTFSYFLSNESLEKPLHKLSQVRLHKVFVLEQALVLKVISRLKKQSQDQLINGVKSLLDY